MKKLIAILLIAGFAGVFTANATPQANNPHPASTPMDNGKGKDKGQHKGEKKEHHHHHHGHGHDHKGGKNK